MVPWKPDLKKQNRRHPVLRPLNLREQETRD
jgi:hypothetical protein